MIKGFVKYLRINISDIKIERRFDNSRRQYTPNLIMLKYFELDNDDIKSSKRRSIIMSLTIIFIISDIRNWLSILYLQF